MDIVTNSALISDRLTSMGLSEDTLHTVVARGQAERNTATELHPANAGGTFAYMWGIHELRSQLLPQGWTIRRIRNFELTVHPDGRMAIAVSGGDQDTGRVDGQPHTRNPKGNQTAQAIASNQFSLFPAPQPVTTERSATEVWFLLYYTDVNEVRLELSLPTDMDEQGRVSNWQTRLILGSVPLDPDFSVAAPPMPPVGPDITIDIKRRVS